MHFFKLHSTFSAPLTFSLKHCCWVPVLTITHSPSSHSLSPSSSIFSVVVRCLAVSTVSFPYVWSGPFETECLCLIATAHLCEHSRHLSRERAEQVDTLITRFILLLGGRRTVMVQIRTHGDIDSNYCDELAARPPPPSRINASTDKRVAKDRFWRYGKIIWPHVALARGITSSGKYSIHITKELINFACGHALLQRLIITVYSILGRPACAEDRIVFGTIILLRLNTVDFCMTVKLVLCVYVHRVFGDAWHWCGKIYWSLGK